MEISVVSPIYRAENIVEELVKQIIDNVEKVSPDFEIILVNDASLISRGKKSQKFVKMINE